MWGRFLFVTSFDGAHLPLPRKWVPGVSGTEAYAECRKKKFWRRLDAIFGLLISYEITAPMFFLPNLCLRLVARYVWDQLNLDKLCIGPVARGINYFGASVDGAHFPLSRK